jgi:hypothetical protein
MKIVIDGMLTGVPALVQADMRRFLPDTPGPGRVVVEASVDPALTAGSWAVDVAGGPENWRIRLSGGDATGVSGAAYTLLERLGFLFEIRGQVIPDVPAWDRLAEGREVTVPVVRRRGIRQHINFAMDISSYPLEEACEYIRNLARMRFNHITFHSYTGQWFEVALPDRKILAGSFFYGQPHPLPEDADVRRRVRNEAVYCIPDIEPCMNEPEERSHRAMAWLRAVLAEAKRSGLYVQFSFEPYTFNSTPDALIACDAILAAYPDIDRLELITRETGGWGPAASENEIRAVARETFGDSVANSPELAQCMRECRRDLATYLRDLGCVMDTLRALPAHRGDRVTPALSCGIYCAVPALLRLSIPLMRDRVPPGIEFAILASHGSRGVAHNLREAGMTRADWARTMVYNWIEFDGLMYYQQNPVRGIRQALEEIDDAAGLQSIRGMAFNHWRTAENATCARYAAEATLHGALGERTFYRERAETMGIARPDLYAAAMMEIDDADGRATLELPNSGFCAGWGGNKIGILRWQLFDNAQRIEEQYDNARLLLGMCSNGGDADGDGHRTSPQSGAVAALYERRSGQTAAGHLALLDNRLRCTVQYLRAIKRAAALVPLCFNREAETLTDDERRQVREICDEALARLDEYRAIFIGNMPDRGCEGLLVSFCLNVPAHLQRVRQHYGEGSEAAAGQSPAQEEPPLPITG